MVVKTNAEKLRHEHQHLEEQTHGLIAGLEASIKQTIQAWERDNKQKLAEYSEMGHESLACAALINQLSFFGRKVGRR